jgi:hypothetical protein
MDRTLPDQLDGHLVENLVGSLDGRRKKLWIISVAVFLETSSDQYMKD